MRKHAKSERSSALPRAEVDVAGFMNAIQKNLDLLGRKIDILINCSSERHLGGKVFSKPLQSFNQPHRKIKPHEGFRQRRLYQVICAECNKECEVPFNPSGDRPVYCKECFARHKEKDTSFKVKFDPKLKEGNFTSGPSFDKRQNQENRGFGRKKKYHGKNR